MSTAPEWGAQATNEMHLVMFVCRMLHQNPDGLLSPAA